MRSRPILTLSCVGVPPVHALPCRSIIAHHLSTKPNLGGIFINQGTNAQWLYLHLTPPFELQHLCQPRSWPSQSTAYINPASSHHDYDKSSIAHSIIRQPFEFATRDSQWQKSTKHAALHQRSSRTNTSLRALTLRSQASRLVIKAFTPVESHQLLTPKPYRCHWLPFINLWHHSRLRHLRRRTPDHTRHRSYSRKRQSTGSHARLLQG